MKSIRLIWLAVMLIMGVCVWAQNGRRIQITSFERNDFSRFLDPVVDKNGVPCAVIRFYTDDVNFVIQPNLGKLKTDILIGEIRVWVPKGTKLITIRHEGAYPLSNYVIPLRIDSRCTYEATLEIIDGSPTRMRSAHDSFYMGAGFNLLPMTGPMVALGLNMNHHQIEAGFTYGLNKTDDLYFYNSKGVVKAGYHYNPFRIQLRYGYELNVVKNVFSIIPQLGGSYHIFRGQDAETIANDGSYKNAQSISALGALRLIWSPLKQMKLHVTPEFLIPIKNDKTCSTLCWYDKTVKKWNKGLSLNVGLMVSF